MLRSAAEIILLGGIADLKYELFRQDRNSYPRVTASGASPCQPDSYLGSATPVGDWCGNLSPMPSQSRNNLGIRFGKGKLVDFLQGYPANLIALNRLRFAPQ